MKEVAKNSMNLNNCTVECNVKYVDLCIPSNKIMMVNILMNLCRAETDADQKIPSNPISDP
jgi:hypothetical protein